ncbi:MaoC family dehydratase N-terminal domain-containing protein [Amycolatopsis rhabdoformis]|uniref:MaoC family dehydratase N-terminal domain-containing protein n=1 Tax=Amycolatopsis rhabdoformis TaxID=1448059 RepID=A0ABZ1IGJ6_9PSEU|nr:MaoC family dehydratase N-terminal domain-containing protein [Amycolatopsis rhabdoformis]WSE32560.1 MaoC family dehydratase N-terminal domain-containing protein [Amycolatopsis rhabdoformis]
MTATSDRSSLEPGRLTDAAFDRSRLRLGIPQPLRRKPHNLEVTQDGTRHFAFGYGDDNPLYCDPDYAKGTRWGTLLAPPGYAYTMGEDAAPAPDDEQKAILKGDPFSGLGSYQAVMEFEWYRPLVLGDRCRLLLAQVGLADKPSRFGGRTAHVTNDFLYANGVGEVHAIRRGTWVNAERAATKERSTKRAEAPEPYTDEQLAAIDAAYAAETRRGAEPRFWEDVEVGDAIQPRVKGPLTTTDVVVWHLGWGMQLTPPGAFRLAYLTRRKVPGMYPPNALNVPDTVQRLHWEPDRAQELGLPTSYDYGGMREIWLTHALTDWMGDDAWLFKLRCEHRKFNYLGDATWVTGEIVAKRVEDGHHLVDLDLRCTNQRGEVTTPGTATVILPSRDHGALTLPTPPADTLDGLVQAELTRFALG